MIRGKAVVFFDQMQLFSIPFHLVTLDQAMLYDLYVNFSSKGKSNKFVKIFKQGNSLSVGDFERFKKKYLRLYVLESQRPAYLKSLARSDTLEVLEKTTIIKDSAIKYLDDLFAEGREFTNEVLNDTIGQCHDVVEAMVEVIQDYDIESLQNHIAALSFHDFYTYDHSINVSMYCISFYRAIRPDADNTEVTLAGLGGMLHDLGKVNISTSIINNPGQLSDEDFKIMRSHPQFGWDMMHEKSVEVPKDVDLDTLCRVIYEHHENYDGTGYPNKLKGDDIHLMARITAICDFFDAITTKRSYHNAMNTSDALSLMNKTKGKKIDPQLFDLFAKHVSTAKVQKDSLAQISSDFDPCMPHERIPMVGFRHDEQK